MTFFCKAVCLSHKYLFLRQLRLFCGKKNIADSLWGALRGDLEIDEQRSNMTGKDADVVDLVHIDLDLEGSAGPIKNRFQVGRTGDSRRRKTE